MADRQKFAKAVTRLLQSMGIGLYLLMVGRVSGDDDLSLFPPISDPQGIDQQQDFEPPHGFDQPPLMFEPPPGPPILVEPAPANVDWFNGRPMTDFGQAGDFEPGFPGLENLVPASEPNYSLAGLARTYYANDQRYEFTGQEATFGVEGVLKGAMWKPTKGWQVRLDAELFLNQPFDRNILVDSADRVSFRGNFEIEPVEISQLYISARKQNFMFAAGRFITPFGRAYFPLLQNDRNDAPFIRSEAILWRETGILLQAEPGPWVFTAAATNGGLDRDTNSSKALIARVGYQFENMTGGISYKLQDGIGSEGQKTTNNHIGADFMVKWKRLQFSTEVIHDQYGLRRPFDALDITWGRSLYYRDINIGRHEPINGVGWYVNLNYDGPNWFMMLNYGEYYPQQVGIPNHDVANRRGIFKVIKHQSECFDLYTSVLVETSLEEAFDSKKRKGFALNSGFQFNF